MWISIIGGVHHIRTPFRLNHAVFIFSVLSSNLWPPSNFKILPNYISLTHYTRLFSSELGNSRGFHHTISCRWFYKLTKMLHRENSNYWLLHYTLKYVLCFGLYVCAQVPVCVCLSDGTASHAPPLITDDAFPTAERKNGARWRHRSLCCHPHFLSFFLPNSISLYL